MLHYAHVTPSTCEISHDQAVYLDRSPQQQVWATWQGQYARKHHTPSNPAPAYTENPEGATQGVTVLRT